MAAARAGAGLRTPLHLYASDFRTSSGLLVIAALVISVRGNSVLLLKLIMQENEYTEMTERQSVVQLMRCFGVFISLSLCSQHSCMELQRFVVTKTERSLTCFNSR